MQWVYGVAHGREQIVDWCFLACGDCDVVLPIQLGQCGEARVVALGVNVNHGCFCPHKGHDRKAGAFANQDDGLVEGSQQDSQF